MSAYPPPNDLTSVYNNSDFTSNTSNLTIADADLRYLKLSGGIENGSVLFNSGLQLPNTGVISTVSNESIVFTTSSIALQVDSTERIKATTTGANISGNLLINNTTLIPGTTASLTLPSTTGTLALTSQIPANTYSFSNGSAASPSLNWVNSSTSGFYRIGSNNLGLTLNGILNINFQTTSTTFINPILASNGTAANPSYSFANSTNCGFYRIGTTEIGLSLNGGLNVDFANDYTTFVNPIKLSTGSASNPSLTFSSNSGMGLFGLFGAQVGVGINCNSAGNDYLACIGTTNIVKLYNSAHGQYISLDNSTNSVEIHNSTSSFIVAPTVITSSVQIASQLGSISSPGYSFTGDSNTGIFSSGADNVDICTGGIGIANFQNFGTIPVMTLYNASGIASLGIVATGLSDSDVTITAGIGSLFLEGSDSIRSQITYGKTTASAANLYMNANSVFFRSTSSAKYKNNIRALESTDLQKVLLLEPKKYKSNSKDDRDGDFYGLISEEVQKVLPELCEFDVNGNPEGVQYTQLIPFILAILKKHEAILNTLK